MAQHLTRVKRSDFYLVAAGDRGLEDKDAISVFFKALILLCQNHKGARRFGRDCRNPDSTIDQSLSFMALDARSGVDMKRLFSPNDKDRVP